MHLKTKFLQRLLPFILFLALFFSCTKTNDNSTFYIDPLWGTWALQYSTYDGMITYYYQDTTINGRYYWASKLAFTDDDTAYWNNWGTDGLPLWVCEGTYKLTIEENKDSMIELNPPIEFVSLNYLTYSKFKYSFKEDSLLLNDLRDTPTIFTYVKK